MKNKKTIIGIVAMVVLALGVITGCSIGNKTYEVTFVSDNEVIDTVQVNKNETVARPTDPTKDGYVFIDWYLDNEAYDFTTKITKDITLTAKWTNGEDTDETNKVVVTFDSNGGTSVASLAVELNGTVEEPTSPTRDGYEFVSWQLDGTDFDFTTKITESITLKAKWEKTSTTTSDETKYTVTFNSNGGTKVSSQKVTANSTAKKPTNPTRSGYTFVEWQLNGKTYSFSTKVTKNITLKAVWKENTTTTSNTNTTNTTNTSTETSTNTNTNTTTTTTDSIESVSISSSSITLKLYGTYVGTEELTAEVKANGSADKTVSWSSSNSSVASVDSNGKVTAKAKGTATITAKAGDKTATCKVTVISYETKWVTIDESTGKQATLYIKSSEGKYVSGTVSVTTQKGTPGTIKIGTSGVVYESDVFASIVIESID